MSKRSRVTRARKARHLTDARRRSFRTLIQVGIAAGVAEPLDSRLDPTEETGLVLIPLFAWAVAYVQNWLEDRGLIPALLKAPPSPGLRPVPRDAAEFERHRKPGER